MPDQSKHRHRLLHKPDIEIKPFDWWQPREEDRPTGDRLIWLESLKLLDCVLYGGVQPSRVVTILWAGKYNACQSGFAVRLLEVRGVVDSCWLEALEQNAPLVDD